MTRRRATGWALGLGLPVVAIILLALFWNWDWFIPIVESRASASLGRPVSIGHLHVGLGRIVRVTAEDVTIANPPDWPPDSQGDPLARITRLEVDADAWTYIRTRHLILPLIALDQPHLHLVQQPDDTANYTLKPAGGGGAQSDVQIGELRIDHGEIAAQLAKLKANFTVAFSTEGSGDDAKIRGTAHGTYAAAPITGQFAGGALLSLRDATKPWPIDLQVENGTTRISLTGTVQDPVHLAGADLRLSLSGQDMANLEPLTGMPIPGTPPFRVTGHLDFAGGEHIRFRDFTGQLGRSDVAGTIDADTGKARMAVTANLTSRQVDLADLGGFIGTTPGRVSTPGQTAAQREQVVRAEAKPNLLPDTPVNVPRLQWADIHLRYHGQHIIGQSVPLDNVDVTLDIVGGAVNIHPISFGVGTGRIKGNIALTPEKGQLRAQADLEFQQVDVSRLMAATHMFHGAGTINGTGRIDTTGRSLAAMLGNSDGGIRLGMSGGNLSALLVDLSGLEFGNALLSALGLPSQTNVECMVADLPVQHGVMRFQPLILDTGEAVINGSGTVDLANEQLDLSLRTQPTHFSIGSLPAPINVTGTFKKPSIRPGAELAVRGGVAAGLAAVFPPLALLPMIQFGTKDNHHCDQILAQLKQQPGEKGDLSRR